MAILLPRRFSSETGSGLELAMWCGSDHLRSAGIRPQSPIICMKSYRFGHPLHSVLGWILVGSLPIGVQAVEPPLINEVSISTVGTDVEFVEVLGSPNTDYSAYTILEIEGDASGTARGTVDEVIRLGLTDASGLQLISLNANTLENGSLTLLLVRGFSGNLNSDLDTNDDGVFDAAPWEAIVDALAINDGGAGDLTYGQPVLAVGYDGLAFAPGGASRIPDGTDTDSATDWVRNDFDLAGIPGFVGSPVLGEAVNTPGAPNQAVQPAAEACGDAFTRIFDVQGSGASTPLPAGSEISVEGIVVGDFQNNAMADTGDLNGFYIQDPVGDGNASTSDGIFIFAPDGIDVSTGDAVRVRGVVSEFFGMTQITAKQIWVCSSGHSVAPVALTLPVSSIGDFEAYEGMLVTFPQPLIITEFFNFDRFGESVLATERLFTPTAVAAPGAEAQAVAAANALKRITLDDGRTTQNPDPAIHPNGIVFDLDNLFRGGDSVTDVTGVMDFRFNLYRIQPTFGAHFKVENPRPLAPEAVGGSLQVAAFNVLNYFTTLGSRGADTPEEFVRQRTKIISALATMNADVVGLIEIENNDAAIKDLVQGVNDLMGAGTYDFLDTGVIGTDEIKVGFIFKPSTVSLVGPHAVLDSSVDPTFIDDKNRPVLAQTFREISTGAVLTVVVNHLKSKGSPCDDIGDPDMGDGQGNCNMTRTNAARAMADWLATDPTGSQDPDILIIGDLNAYAQEDPIHALLAGSDDTPGTADDYIDLQGLLQGQNAYTYVFDGQLGYLDHALASPSLLSAVTGVTQWHINADEADLIDYDMTFKKPAQDLLYEPNAFRSSDHDPVIVGLDLCDEVPPTLNVTVSRPTLWPANHKLITVTTAVTAADNLDPNPAVSLVSVTSNEADDGIGDGKTTQDIVIVDDFTVQLRAERSGRGMGRVYTLTYKATDTCGNETLASVQVVVPRSLK